LVFIDASEDTIMTDVVVTPLNLRITLIKTKEFEETSFNVNVSQHLNEEKPT